MNSENESLCPPAIRNFGYSLGEEISSGEFSKVFKCRIDSKPNQEFVCKRIDIMRPLRTSDGIKQELKVLKKVQHPNIIKIRGLFKTRRTVFIFMDYATNGSIFKLLEHLKMPFVEKTAKLWFSQILSALTFCHSRGVAHRNIKLDNFLLNSDFDALLTDFSFSVIASDKSGTIIRSTACGHPSYLAPELEPRTRIWPYDAKAGDMYALGVCLFEMLNFDKPFDENLALTNPMVYVLKQKKKEFKFHAPIYRVISAEIKDLVNQLLEPRPGIRIKAENALMHVSLSPN